MEKNFVIKAKDRKNIYGILNFRSKTDKLIIFVHGLTGNTDEHIFYNGAKYFTSKGFATARFALYTGLPNARKLSDCDITTHTNDLNDVIKHFSAKYKIIYVIGHSLGGPPTINADLTKVKAIVLWDPSLKLEKIAEELCSYNKSLDKYIIQWGTENILSKSMIKQWSELDLRMIEKISVPTSVICAGNGVLKKHWIKYIDRIKTEHELFIIKSAGHTFSEENVEEELFKKTLAFLRKH